MTKQHNMVEDLGDTIGGGFDTWKNNLNICIPFMFNLVITSALAIGIMGSVFIKSIPALTSYLTNPAEISPDLILQLLPEILQDMGLIILTLSH